MASVVIFPPFSKRYSLAEVFVVESDLNHTLKLTSSAAAKSRSASSARDARTFVSPLKAFPNLPEFVNPPVVVEKAKSLAFVDESQKSFEPPEQVFKLPSSNFQCATADPIGLP